MEKPFEQNEKLDFSKAYFKILESKIDGIELISIDELKIKTEFKQNNHTHFLVNSYAEYINDPKSKNDILDRYTDVSMDLYMPFYSLDLNRIVPIVKDHRFLAEMNKISPGEETNYYYQPYNDNLVIFFAEDNEGLLKFLMKDQIIENKINSFGLLGKSIDNLENIVPGIERHGDRGYFMLTAGGNYEASLILIKSLWNKEYLPILGEIVVGIPSNDLILITGSEDKENMDKIRSSINDLNINEKHLVSRNLFIFKENKFEILKNE